MSLRVTIAKELTFTVVLHAAACAFIVSWVGQCGAEARRTLTHRVAVWPDARHTITFFIHTFIAPLDLHPVPNASIVDPPA